MGILDSIFTNNKSVEQPKRLPKQIGVFEAQPENIVNTFLGVMSAMGMGTPSTVSTTGSKSVRVKKNGSNYVITLYSFQPPVEIVWSPTFPIRKLIDFINLISEKNRDVCSYNIVKTTEGDIIQFSFPKVKV